MHYDHAREGTGVRAVVFKADQGDAVQGAGLVTAVVQRCGRLDILVNTAGVYVASSDEGKETKDEEASRQCESARVDLCDTKCGEVFRQ